MGHKITRFIFQFTWLFILMAGFLFFSDVDQVEAQDAGCIAQWQQNGLTGGDQAICQEEPYINVVTATLDSSQNNVTVYVNANSGATYQNCTNANQPGWQILYPGFFGSTVWSIISGPSQLVNYNFGYQNIDSGGSTDCVVGGIAGSPPTPDYDEWQSSTAIFDVSGLPSSAQPYNFTVRVRNTAGQEATYQHSFTINRAVQPATINVTSNCATNWTISGPQNFSGSGTSAQYVTSATGSYTISPAALSGRSVSTSPQTHNVQAGGTYNFNLTYSPLPCVDPPPPPPPVDDPPPPGCQGDCAQYSSQNVPTSLNAGQAFNVSITMTNVGTTTWTAGTDYKIGTQAVGAYPQNHMTWGANRVTVPNNVAPGQQVTFNTTLVAPSSGGSYPFYWCMLRENVAWFTQVNPCTPQTNITVSASPASLVCSPASSSIGPNSPTTFTAGGGVGPYTWAVNPPDASPPNGSGTSFNTFFTVLGPKTVTVSDSVGSTPANCQVNVVSNVCVPLDQPTNGQVLATDQTTPSFTFTSVEGRTHYILDLTYDPSFSWWWNNGVPGLYKAPSPVQSSTTIPYSAINSTTYSQGIPIPAELQRGVTYYWRVYAYVQGQEGAGCHSPVFNFSILSNTPTFTVNYTPAQLNTPTLNALTNSICKQIRLDWDFTSNGVEQGFRVERSATGANGGFVQIAQLPPAARTYTDNDPTLQPGNTYYYRVGAYTDAAPPRINYSNVQSASVLDCTANFSTSTMSVATINGVPYTAASVIKNGDVLGLRMVLTNTGPAHGTVTSVVEHISTNLTNPNTLVINKGGGNSNGVIGNNGLVDNDTRLSLSLRQSAGVEINGVKCVSPGNPTSCTPAVDPSCRVTPIPPLCNNWVVTHRVTVTVDENKPVAVINGRYFIAFTDQSGSRVQRIDMPSILFLTGKRLPPEFMEVAP